MKSLLAKRPLNIQYGARSDETTSNAVDATAITAARRVRRVCSSIALHPKLSISSSLFASRSDFFPSNSPSFGETDDGNPQTNGTTIGGDDAAAEVVALRSVIFTERAGSFAAEAAEAAFEVDGVASSLVGAEDRKTDEDDDGGGGVRD